LQRVCLACLFDASGSARGHVRVDCHREREAWVLVVEHRVREILPAPLPRAMPSRFEDFLACTMSSRASAV
jgi:hypothetical protein